MNKNRKDNVELMEHFYYMRGDDRLNKELTKEEYNQRLLKEEKIAREILQYAKDENMNMNDDHDYYDLRDFISNIFQHIYITKELLKEFVSVFGMMKEMKLYASLNYPSTIDIFKHNVKQLEQSKIDFKLIYVPCCTNKSTTTYLKRKKYNCIEFAD